jgi:hypothetical protein
MAIKRIRIKLDRKKSPKKGDIVKLNQLEK